jgi:tRNA(fMet)-specific endonuclease VapC
LAFLIDSSIIIAYERQGKSTEAFFEHLSDAPVALAAITASELLHGIHRAEDGRRRAQRERFVETILSGVPVLPFTLDIARVHSRLWADLLARGAPIGLHDMMIAATALAYSHTVVTHNLREFRRVEGLVVQQW